MSRLIHPVHASLARAPQRELGLEADVTKIADTQTAVPGGIGDFTFFTYPSIGGDGVAFVGAGSAQPSNLYLSQGGSLSLLVRVGAPYPELGAFTSLGLPNPGDDQVAFWGQGLVGGPGIYTALPRELRVVANRLFAVPGGAGNFTSFESNAGPGISGDRVAFVGSDGNNQPGVYLGIPAQSNVSLIANTQSSLPDGQGTFTFFSSAGISGSRVAFFGSNQSSNPIQAGIYTAEIGSSLTKAADTNTAAPDGSGNFTGFTTPTVSGARVAFTATTQRNSGVYLWDNGTLSTVANMDTSVPGGVGTFGGFNNAAPSSDAGDIVFWGADSAGNAGIYASAGGQLVKVIDQNETIAGQQIIFLGLDTHQASGGIVTFYAVLANKVFGEYTIPVPST